MSINKITGFNGKSFSSKGKTNLARARRLYSSIANVNETSKGQYTTTPEMADIFLRYTTAAGLSSKSHGTEMFSKNGTKEGLYGTERGKGCRKQKHGRVPGTPEYLPGNSRFKKVLAPGATREMDEVKKRVLNDEYNTHYLDLLVSGYALAQSSGDKKAANEWLKAVTTYAKTAPMEAMERAEAAARKTLSSVWTWEWFMPRAKRLPMPPAAVSLISITTFPAKQTPLHRQRV